MVKVMCKENIEDVLAHPEEYVDETFDKPLIAVFSSTTIDNPTYLMVGQDENNKKFYLVVEDADTSEDYYPSDNESLSSLFDNLLIKTVKEEIYE